MRIYSLLMALVMVFSVALMGCGTDEGPAEKAGKQIDQTVEKAGDKMEDTGDKISDSVEDAKEKLGEKMEEAGEKLQ